MQTRHGRQYLERYCRYWSGLVPTECEQDYAHIDFDNVIVLQAHADLLHVTIRWQRQDVRTVHRLFVQNLGRCLSNANELTFRWMALMPPQDYVSGRLH